MIQTGDYFAPPPSTGAAPGKEKLVEAALRLAARKRSFEAIGLRELAREAGLNPNTFYRHFSTLEELGLTMIDVLGQRLRAPLRLLRLRSFGQPTDVIICQAVHSFFELADQTRDEFTVAAVELHGASAAMRHGVRQVMSDIASDLADDIVMLNIAPALDAATVTRVARRIVVQMFHLALDYLEEGTQLETITTEALELVNWLFDGASARAAQADQPRN